MYKCHKLYSINKYNYYCYYHHICGHINPGVSYDLLKIDSQMALRESCMCVFDMGTKPPFA